MTYWFNTLPRNKLLKTRFKTAGLKVTHSIVAFLECLLSFHTVLDSRRRWDSWMHRADGPEIVTMYTGNPNTEWTMSDQQKTETCGSTQELSNPDV